MWEGLVNLAKEIAQSGAVWLPILSRVVGVAFVLGAGLLQIQVVRAGPVDAMPKGWVPLFMAMCGFLMLGFGNVLRALSETVGGSGGEQALALTAYTTPDLSGLAGMDPLAGVVFLVTAFIWFFRFVGACFVFQGIAHWKATVQGLRRYPGFFVVTKLVSGTLTMNADVVAKALQATLGS